MNYFTTYYFISCRKEYLRSIRTRLIRAMENTDPSMKRASDFKRIANEFLSKFATDDGTFLTPPDPESEKYTPKTVDTSGQVIKIHEISRYNGDYVLSVDTKSSRMVSNLWKSIRSVARSRCIIYGDYLVIEYVSRNFEENLYFTSDNEKRCFPYRYHVNSHLSIMDGLSQFPTLRRDFSGDYNDEDDIFNARVDIAYNIRLLLSISPEKFYDPEEAIRLLDKKGFSSNAMRARGFQSLVDNILKMIKPVEGEENTFDVYTYKGKQMRRI